MRVTLYTKPSCHLCDVVKAELLDVQSEVAFDLVERNILEDEALYDTYWMCIPVVEIATARSDTKEPNRLQAPINQIELRRQIKVAAAREAART